MAIATPDPALRDGGVDGGGSFCEYRFEGRIEAGWFDRRIGDSLLMESFSGDYLVSHYILPRDLVRVYSVEEVVALQRAG